MLILPQSSFAQALYQIDLNKESWVIGGSLVGLGGSLIFDNQLHPLTADQVERLSRSDVNVFDRSATYNYDSNLSGWSNILVDLSILSPLALLAGHSARSQWFQLGVMYGETILLSTIAVTLVKPLAHRTRPYAYHPDAPISSKLRKDTRRSFYSAHTATAFSSAIFLSAVYSKFYPESRWKFPVTAGSLILASAVGYLRFASGKHFPTDVLAGAAIGSAIGYLVPLLHEKNRESNQVYGGFGIAPGYITCCIRL
jgi:membrane-associated phospholipid phosphatase